MSKTQQDVVHHLLDRVRQVQRSMGADAVGEDAADAPLADLLDSMGMVEFLTLVAADCGTSPAVIEESVQRQFGNLRELAQSLSAAGLRPTELTQQTPAATPTSVPLLARRAQLCATAVHLPACYQPADFINNALRRPAGWLEERAGIHGRHLWADEDPLTAATETARRCLAEAELSTEEVGALLVPSEAPLLVVGQAAALHDRLGLRTDVPAIEVGGACTGFLAALRLGQALLQQTGVVVIIALEAPSHYLTLQPGAPGEAAALFGDAAAACVLCDRPVGRAAVGLGEVRLGVDGSVGHLLRVERAAGEFELRMHGTALATRAVRALTQAVHDVTGRSGLTVEKLRGAVVHGGNGRIVRLVARQLNLPPERVWSETPRSGNLGAASLPVAWAAHQPVEAGPVVWAAVGAGLSWGAALLGGGNE